MEYASKPLKLTSCYCDKCPEKINFHPLQMDLVVYFDTVSVTINAKSKFTLRLTMCTYISISIKLENVHETATFHIMQSPVEKKIFCHIQRERV